MDLSVITTTLLEKDYHYDAKDDVYYRAVADGSTDEVAIDAVENIVSITRLNHRNQQTAYKEVKLNSVSKIQMALNMF